MQICIRNLYWSWIYQKRWASDGLKQKQILYKHEKEGMKET